MGLGLLYRCLVGLGLSAGLLNPRLLLVASRFLFLFRFLLWWLQDEKLVAFEDFDVVRQQRN